MTEAHRDAVIKEGQRPVTLILLIVCAALVSLSVSPNPYGVLGALFGCLALMIAYVDSRTFIIPDWLTGAGLLLGLASAVALRAQYPIEALQDACLRGFVVASIFFGLRWLYRMLRGRQGIGLGDVKLAAVAGVWLDWPMIPVAIELACAGAICVHMFRQLTLRRRIRGTGMVPFGLFFAPAIWAGWVLQAALLNDLFAWVGGKFTGLATGWH